MVFKSKKDKFAVMLLNISSNLKEASDYFADYKLKNISDLKIFSDTMKQYETTGDEYIHEVIKELEQCFYHTNRA